MTLNGVEVKVASVWFAKVTVLQLLRCLKAGDERGAVFVQYVEVAIPLAAMAENLGCICMSWSGSD